MSEKTLELQSPRLQALLTRWQAGDTAVLTHFWQEMTQATTPLVEAISDDDAHRLVTFLWRDEAHQLTNVCVTEGPAGFDFHLGQMARLADTDVWYRTYRLPADTCLLYHLSPDNPMPAWGSAAWADFWDAFDPHFFRDDPLNPRRHADGSLLKLPDAPQEPWFSALPDERTGRLDIQDVDSHYLNGLRCVRIYTPAGYKADGSVYPWLLLFDGATYADAIATTMLDNLIDQGMIPPLVVLFVNGTWAERRTDLNCNPQFNAFLVEELLPWARQAYRLSSDPARSAVGGFSLGGLAATFAALQHPYIFGNVLAQSGFFMWTPQMTLQGLQVEPTAVQHNYAWIIRQFVTRECLPLRFHLDVGVFDYNGQPELHSNILMVNRHFRDVLQAKGYDVDYVEFSGGHDFVGWRVALPQALHWLIQ